MSSDTTTTTTTSMTKGNDDETKFLLSRQARAEQRHRMQQRKRIHDRERESIHRFWNDTRAYLRDWKTRLDDFVEDPIPSPRSTNPATAATATVGDGSCDRTARRLLGEFTETEKRRIRLMLDRHKQELQALQKQCLTATTTTMTTSPSTTTTTTPASTFSTWSSLLMDQKAFRDDEDEDVNEENAWDVGGSTNDNNSDNDDSEEIRNGNNDTAQTTLDRMAQLPLVAGDEEEEEIEVDVARVQDEIPVSDLRMLHDEITKHEAMLHRARKMLLPKGKFVFTRYRKALSESQQQQQQQQQEQQRDVGTDTKDSCTSSTLPPRSDPEQQQQQRQVPNCLSDIANAYVVIDADGRVTRVRGNKSQQTGEEWKEEDLLRHQQEQQLQLQSKNMSVSPILRNIQDSTIELQCPTYKSVHIIGIQNSTIRFATRTSATTTTTTTTPITSTSGIVIVDGPIHITDCHNVQIQLPSRCQQLRMHESTYVTCTIIQSLSTSNNRNTTSSTTGVSAGAILEDCRRILFVIEQQQQQQEQKQKQQSTMVGSNSAPPNKMEATNGGGERGGGVSLDIKDFNHLKKGIPSPNYTVEWTTKSISTTGTVQALAPPPPTLIASQEIVLPTPSSLLHQQERRQEEDGTIKNQNNHEGNNINENDDDDDDEL